MNILKHNTQCIVLQTIRRHSIIVVFVTYITADTAAFGQTHENNNNLLIFLHYITTIG